MRVLTLAVLTAAGISLAAPAFAGGGIYVGAGPRGVGVGVDVDGPRHYHRDRVRTKRVYVDDHARAHCRTTIIKRDGMTKKIKRCD
jgi:hypothetical protein